jgi:hypothetical protein
VIMEPTGKWESITGKGSKEGRGSESQNSILSSSNFRKVLHAEEKYPSTLEKNAEGTEVARWYAVKDREVPLGSGRQIHLALDYRPWGGNREKIGSGMVLWRDKDTNTLYLTDQQGRLSDRLTKQMNTLTNIRSGSGNVSQANKTRFAFYL